MSLFQAFGPESVHVRLPGGLAGRLDEQEPRRNFWSQVGTWILMVQIEHGRSDIVSHEFIGKLCLHR